MAHPYHEHRAHKVERARVDKLYRASGGRCGPEETSSVKGDREIAHDAEHRGSRGHLRGSSPAVRKKGGHVHGAKGKHRMDRKHGGKVAHRQMGGLAGAMPPPPPPRQVGVERPMSGGPAPGAPYRPPPTINSVTGRVKGLKHGGKPHRARGGRAHGDEAEDRAMIKRMVKPSALEHRASGGRTKHKGRTVVNVMVGQHPHPGAGMPMMPPPPIMPPRGLPPGMPPGGPPGLAGGLPPGGPPGMPPGGMPPGLPPRATGGAVPRVSHPLKTVKPKQGHGATSRAVGPARAVGLAVHDRAKPLSGAKSTPGDTMPGNPPGWTESAKHKTPVQHTDGKTDGPDIGRGKPITYHKGGAVKNVSKAIAPAKPMQGPSRVSAANPPAYSGGATSRAVKPVKAPARIGLSGGSHGGIARLEKARRASPRGAL